MQLTTEYRENKTSHDHKDFYLICKVQFSHEELAVAGERGMWDNFITLPADEPPVGSGHETTSTMMTAGAGCLIPVALISGCMASIAPSVGRTDAPPWWFVIIAGLVGITLGVMAMFRRGNAKVKGIPQKLTIARLASNGTFQVHAYTLDQAKTTETEIREGLTAIANTLRRSTVIPEQNTYEL
jgi:hypothetical protein